MIIKRPKRRVPVPKKPPKVEKSKTQYRRREKHRQPILPSREEGK